MNDEVCAHTLNLMVFLQPLKQHWHCTQHRATPHGIACLHSNWVCCFLVVLSQLHTASRDTVHPVPLEWNDASFSLY